jgi:hypothetical protein
LINSGIDITDNLFGVDLMEEATEIAKLRLFLALMASAPVAEQLEPLPNIDFNILAGNSLIGLLRVEAQEFDAKQDDLFRKSYREILAEKNRKIETYRHTVAWADGLSALKQDIEAHKAEAQTTLNDLLLDQWHRAGIKFEEATWDAAKGKEGKPNKRNLTPADLEALHPFHWGFEFDEILHRRGGFDAVITNPPWEIFKPLDKGFAKEHAPEIERRGTGIKDFEKRFDHLLKQPGILDQYLKYLSLFPHASAWFRLAPQYQHQSTVVNGRKTGTDINLFKLFTEQCYNLLRGGGECGIVIPSGIYTDLGAKGLRDMLFDETQVTGLFCFENRKEIFEGVDSRFKFVVMTFEKGGKTVKFPAMFMRHEVAELSGFPREIGLPLSVELIRRLSPDSHSAMEFKSATDIRIAEKMLKFPLLGEKIEGKWNLALANEFHMTNDSHLFKAEPGGNRLPLYEGKMIWHFEHGREPYRYWIDRKIAEQDEIQRRTKKINKLLGKPNGGPYPVSYPFDCYRMGFRSITGATNERALVVSVLPKGVVTGNSLTISVPVEDRVVVGKWQETRLQSNRELLALVALMSSFICDWFMRLKILTNMNMFYVYQLPVPRLIEGNEEFAPIATRAARLACTTPEFDDLAKEAGLKSHRDGATDPAERARLRAELDGLIAHLYGLAEAEFAHILATFRLVPEPVKIAALNAYRDVERGLIR